VIIPSEAYGKRFFCTVFEKAPHFSAIFATHAHVLMFCHFKTLKKSWYSLYRKFSFDQKRVSEKEWLGVVGLEEIL
jgi:hypothetical protein